MFDEVINVQDQHYILATSARPDERSRVLKHGETFAVFDRHGDLRNVGLGEHGLFHEGTRYLSRLELRLGKKRPLLLSSTIQQANALLTADLTNPDITINGDVVLHKGVLHIHRTKFLWNAAAYEQIRVSNYGIEPVAASLTILIEADFVDIFEVRGNVRPRRGQLLPPVVHKNGVTLGYRGLDGVVRKTHLQCDPPPRELTASSMVLEFDLAAHDSVTFTLVIACDGESHPAPLSYDLALEDAAAASRTAKASQCLVSSSNEQFDEWMSRSISDLDMMITETAHGRYPYGGVPWFSTPFGRDGIITALQMLWFDPTVARGVLGFLAAHQASEFDAASDAHPGKILHETRKGEMAALGEVPFARYYGSVDSTPLFVMLAGAYYRRTADRIFLEHLWPHLDRALQWIDRVGDADGDGFVEYQRSSPTGLLHQGWKDSHDSVFHADGTLVEGPVALCEVQGYVFAARREAAAIAALLGMRDRAAELTLQADRLQREFERVFWCEELNTYALALDGQKKPCRVVTSNPGHCLYTGIASPARAQRVADTLFRDSSYSGWGIRTVASGQNRYNPMSYHDGSVWPHDNALIALGLAQYGFKARAVELFSGFFDSTLYLDLKRLPELFCGFNRRSGEGPTLYPIACLPQAWAAGSVFMLLQAALGLTIDGAKREVTLTRPVLPEWLPRLQIENLAVGDATVDLFCDRHPHDVGISVLRRRGDVTVVHIA